MNQEPLEEKPLSPAGAAAEDDGVPELSKPLSAALSAAALAGGGATSCLAEEPELLKPLAGAAVDGAALELS